MHDTFGHSKWWQCDDDQRWQYNVYSKFSEFCCFLLLLLPSFHTRTHTYALEFWRDNKGSHCFQRIFFNIFHQCLFETRTKSSIAYPFYSWIDSLHWSFSTCYSFNCLLILMEILWMHASSYVPNIELSRVFSSLEEVWSEQIFRGFHRSCSFAGTYWCRGWSTFAKIMIFLSLKS